MYRMLRAALPAVCIAFAVSAGTSADAFASTAKNTWQGTASYYGPGFHGRRTANGERFNMHGLTAAHRRTHHEHNNDVRQGAEHGTGR